MASFTTSGSTPQSNSFLSGYSASNTGTTPAAKALSSAANMSTPTGQVYVPPPVAPTTPVKSTAVTHPDGTQVTTTYHAPEPGLLSSAPAGGSSSSSNVDTNYQLQPGETTAAYNARIASYNAGQGSNGTNTQTPTQPASTGTTAPSSATPTFSGLVGQTVNTATGGSPAAQGYTADTANYGAGNIPIGQSAANIASTYGQQIANVGQQGAQFEGGQLTTGTSPVAEGNAAVTAQTTAAEQQALASGESAALQGTQQQLTAQDQAASAANQAAGQATTAQTQKLGGLESATGSVAPQQNYPFVFNPATGTYTNAATGGMVDASSAAQAVLSGQVSYADAKSALGYLGTSAEAQLQSAILQQNPGANLNQLEAQAAGQQAVAGAPYGAQASNIGTAGTAQAGAYNSIYGTATSAAAATATQQAQIRSVGTDAINAMQAAGINPTSSQFANKTINQLQSELSSPQYAQFNTAMQALAARVGAALQAGEIPTAATSNATAIANGNISLSALASTLSQVDDELGQFVDTQNGLAAYAKSQIGSTGGSSASGNDPLGIL